MAKPLRLDAADSDNKTPLDPIWMQLVTSEMIDGEAINLGKTPVAPGAFFYENMLASYGTGCAL